MTQENEDILTDERTINFTTECKVCIFSEWDELNLSQVGCKLNRIHKYIDSGLANSVNDEETGKQSYVVNTICNTCRNEDWENFCKENQYDINEKLENEIAVKLDAIILSFEQTGNVVKNIYDTVKDILSQTKKINSIKCVVKNYDISYTDLHSKLTELTEGYKYELIRITDKNLDILNCIDLACNKLKGNYYCIFMAGLPIRNDIVEKLNLCVNYDLLQPILIYDDEHNLHQTIFNTTIHKVFYGNKSLPLIDKIKEAAFIQEKQNMILHWNEI